MEMNVEKWDPGKVERGNLLVNALKFIRVEHTLFSLPFAYTGALLVNCRLSISQIFFLFFALFGLRTFAMAINNIIDYPIDKLNPRTQGRHLVSGEISFKAAWVIAVTGLLIFLFSSYMLNIYALLFSPVAVLVVATYPYAKRIHSYPHFHLGFALGFAVAGGAIGVVDQNIGILEAIAMIPWTYVFAVVLWVAGFDIFYSIMDYDFDKEHGLGSIPVKFGVDNALKISALTHALFLALLIVGFIEYSLGIFSALTFILTGILVALEHVYLRLGLNIKKAFNINLVISLTVSIGIIADKLIMCYA